MSKTVNTPINKISKPKKQIKYALFKCFTLSQLANKHIGINSVVNNIKTIDIPSTPNIILLP